MEQTNELVKVIESCNLEQQTAISLKERFMPFFDQAEEWKKRAEALVVTDETQTREMKMAREARLALKDIRVGADKTRKLLKEDSIRYGRAVQGIYNVIEYLIIPIEKHLQEQEDFVKIREEKRRAEIKAEREIEVEPYMEFIPFGLDFGNMSDEDYEKLLNGAKLQLQAKIDAERKAEEERIARERAEAEERERIRRENERLRKEKEAAEARMRKEREIAEAKLKKEREAAEAKLRAEREAAEKVRKEAETKARVEREAAQAKMRAEKEAADKARKEREIMDAKLRAVEAKIRQEKEREEIRLRQEREAIARAEAKAKAAPDKEKLLQLSKNLSGYQFPELKTDEANKILSVVKGTFVKITNYINNESLKL